MEQQEHQEQPVFMNAPDDQEVEPPSDDQSNHITDRNAIGSIIKEIGKF